MDERQQGQPNQSGPPHIDGYYRFRRMAALPPPPLQSRRADRGDVHSDVLLICAALRDEASQESS